MSRLTELTLNFVGNEIGASGAESLSTALRGMDKLTALTINLQDSPAGLLLPAVSCIWFLKVPSVMCPVESV